MAHLDRQEAVPHSMERGEDDMLGGTVRVTGMGEEQKLITREIGQTCSGSTIE